MTPVPFLRLAALVAILLALAGASITTPQAGGITKTTRLSRMGTMTTAASMAHRASTSVDTTSLPGSPPHLGSSHLSGQVSPTLTSATGTTTTSSSVSKKLPSASHTGPPSSSAGKHTASSSLTETPLSPPTSPHLPSGPASPPPKPSPTATSHQTTISVAVPTTATPPSFPASPPPPPRLTAASPPTGTTPPPTGTSPPPHPGNGTNGTTPFTSHAVPSSSTNDSTAPIVVVSLVGLVVLVGLGTLLYVWARTRRAAAPARAETPPAIELQPLPPGSRAEPVDRHEQSRVSWDDWFR